MSIQRKKDSTMIEETKTSSTTVSVDNVQVKINKANDWVNSFNSLFRNHSMFFKSDVAGLIRDSFKAGFDAAMQQK